MMIYSVIIPYLNQLSNLQIIWSIFLFVLIFVTVKICIFILKYAIWSRKISKTVPGIKLRFFNLLGIVGEFPLSKKSRNGQCFLAHAQEKLLGVAKLLDQEKIYCVWTFIYPIIVLSKAEAVELICSGTKTIEKPFFYNWTKIFFGNSIVTSASDRWKHDRKMLNHCFRPDIIKEHLQIINEQSQKLLKRLERETDKDFTRISKYLSDCTFDIICEIIYGVDVGAQQCNKDTAPFVSSFGKGFRLLTHRFMKLYLWPDFIFHLSQTGRKVKYHSQIARDFTTKLIEREKQKYLEDSEIHEKKGKSLVKLLLQHYYLSKDMSEEDIRDHLMTFMIAGQDTSKISMCWILYLLGLERHVQEKVHQELDSIFGEDYERHATAEDLKNMKYLECVIKETLRLYPPATLFARYLAEDTTICGYQIPKGTTCFVFPHVLHRDANVFPNPEKFNPDRFLPENSKNRHPFAWIPFSAGPRNCIGKSLALMELLTISSTILRRYTVESLDHRDKVLPTISSVLQSSMPQRIRIRHRHSKEN